VGFSLGQLPFGHVIPLGIVAGCGVGGEEKQGKVGKKGGRESGVIEQGVADRKRENKRQVFVNEGGRDVQADDDAAKAAGIAAETPGRFACQPAISQRVSTTLRPHAFHDCST
jgi:hypothetical protein